MRWVAVLIGSLSVAVVSTATAAVPDPSLSREALFGAAFATPSAFSPSSVDFAAPGLRLSRDEQGETRFVPGLGIMRYTTGEVASFGGGDLPYVDSIRFSSASLDPRLGATLLRPGYAGAAGGQGLDVAYIRNWPQALSLDAGRLTFDVTPHAGLGVLAGGGRTAEAGALVKLQQKMLRAVGMGGGEKQGHLSLFAGASEQAVGFNTPHPQVAMGPDPDDGFISEAQAGIGFQRGVLEASFGFSHQSMRLDALGDESRIDNRVGLHISIH